MCQFFQVTKCSNILNLFPLLSAVAAAAIKLANDEFVDGDAAILLLLLFVFDDDITVFCFKCVLSDLINLIRFC
jgi:hypothetical protein